MKKLVLLLAVAFSVSLFSCGGSDKTAECDSTCCDSNVEAVVEEAIVEVDSAAVDTTVAVDSAVVAE